MHSDRNGKIRFTPECRTLVTGVAPTGVCASYSSSIVEDFRNPSIPKCVGQRQTTRRTLGSGKVPGCERRITGGFFLLVINYLPQYAGTACGRSKSFAHGPMRLELKWQRGAIFAHPSSTAFFLVFQTPDADAAFMANPEV